MSPATISPTDLAVAQHRHGADEGWLTCTTCGRLVRDTPEQNASFAATPYPHDQGIGCCRVCGGTGTPPIPGESEAATRRRLGWAMCAFVDARLPVVRQRLSPAAVAKLGAMSYAKQAAVVAGLVRKGVMV